MSTNDSIVFHATHGYLHVQALLDIGVPNLSTMSEALLKDTSALLDGLAKLHTQQTYKES